MVNIANPPVQGRGIKWIIGNTRTTNQEAWERTRQVQSLTLKLAELDCACCAEELEAQLRASVHGARAHVDFQAEELQIAYHEEMFSQGEIRALVDGVGPLPSRWQPTVSL